MDEISISYKAYQRMKFYGFIATTCAGFLIVSFYIIGWMQHDLKVAQDKTPEWTEDQLQIAVEDLKKIKEGIGKVDPTSLSAPDDWGRVSMIRDRFEQLPATLRNAAGEQLKVIPAKAPRVVTAELMCCAQEYDSLRKMHDTSIGEIKRWDQDRRIKWRECEQMRQLWMKHFPDPKLRDQAAQLVHEGRLKP